MIAIIENHPWLLIVIPPAMFVVGYVTGRLLRRLVNRKKLKDVPRPNRKPYDKDSFRR
jgi:hypothetical protein